MLDCSSHSIALPSTNAASERSEKGEDLLICIMHQSQLNCLMVLKIYKEKLDELD